MGRNFAHSETHVNGELRYCRSEVGAASCYHGAMKVRIREVREAQGVSGRDLAARISISESYLSEIERGVKVVNSRRLEQLARALGVTVPDLIADGESDPAVAAHMAVFESLSPEDRAAVQRHAESLLASRPKPE